MPHPPRRQHLISKALLRRFTNPSDSAQLRSFDLKYGQSHLAHPSQVAWAPAFIAHEAEAMESLWQEVERDLPEALASIDAGTTFDDTHLVAVLKRTIALHFVRRTIARDIFDCSAAVTFDEYAVPPHFQGNPDVLRAVVQFHYLKLQPEIFASGLRAVYENALRFADEGELEVGHTEKPLLISDQAVVSIDKDGRGGFTAFAAAATHVLTVGPQVLISLGPVQRELLVDDERVQEINTRHLLEAKRHLFYRSDPQLTEWIVEARARAIRTTSGTANETTGKAFVPRTTHSVNGYY
jgi:hypothetical protein